MVIACQENCYKPAVLQLWCILRVSYQDISTSLFFPPHAADSVASWLHFDSLHPLVTCDRSEGSEMSHWSLYTVQIKEIRRATANPLSQYQNEDQFAYFDSLLPMVASSHISRSPATPTYLPRTLSALVYRQASQRSQGSYCLWIEVIISGCGSTSPNWFRLILALEETRPPPPADRGAPTSRNLNCCLQLLLNGTERVATAAGRRQIKGDWYAAAVCSSPKEKLLHGCILWIPKRCWITWKSISLLMRWERPKK